MPIHRIIMLVILFAMFGCTQCNQDKPIYSNVNIEGLRSGNMFYPTGIRTSDGVLHTITNTRWMGTLN